MQELQHTTYQTKKPPVKGDVYLVEDRTHSDLELLKSPEIRETLIDTSSDRSV